MAASAKMESLFLGAEAESARVSEAAAEARAQAVASIRRLEERLLRAIGGDHVRGLERLAPDYYGANVRARGQHGIDTYLPPGREALCIGKDGRLQLACTRATGTAYRAARDGDLRAEDLDLYVRALARVLERHAAYAGRTSEAHGKVIELAARVDRALR